MRTIGIVLVVIGLAMTLFTGFNLITKNKVVDVGPIEITKEKKEPVSWSPIIGIVVLATGIGLIAFDKKGK